MPEMNYSGGPGGYSLTTSGSPGVTGSGYMPGGNEDLINFYKEMARRSLPRMASPTTAGLGGGGASPAYGAPGPSYARPTMDSAPAKSPMDVARERDELLQMQARQQPAPMRMVTGAGITPGYVMDTNAMNAYQRQAYLPQGSSRAFTPMEGAAAKGAYDEETDWNAGMAADRARTHGMSGEVGGAAPGTPGGSVMPRGTAPMLTPSNAAMGGRPMSDDERRRQAAINAIYGR